MYYMGPKFGAILRSYDSGGARCCRELRAFAWEPRAANSQTFSGYRYIKYMCLCIYIHTYVDRRMYIYKCKDVYV